MSLKSLIVYFTIFYLAIMICLGIYYEDMTDVFISVMSRGYFTSEPIAIFNNYGAHFLLNHLYTGLNKLYPFGWYGILNLFFQYLSIVNTLILLYTLLKPDKIKSNWIIMGIFLVYISSDIIFLQYTKTAIYLICSSGLNIFYQEIREKPASSKVIFANMVLFIIGLLIRPQGLYLSILVLLPFLYFNRKLLLAKFNIVKFAAHGFIGLVSLIVIFNYSRSFTKTDTQYDTFSQYSSSVWDGKQPLNTLHLNSKKDSAIYFSFQNYFFPDIELINPSLLDRIGIFKRHYAYDFLFVALVKEVRFKIEKVNSELDRLYEEANLRFQLLFMLLLLLLYTSTKNTSAFIKSCIQFGWTATFILFITFVAKMEHRVVFPVALFSFICSLFYLPRLYLKKGLANGFLVLINLLFCWQLLYYNAYRCIDRRKGQSEIRTLLKHIDQSDKKNVYILDLFSINILSNDILESSLYNSQADWFCFDAGYHVFYDEYTAKRQQLIHAGTFKESMLALKAAPGKYIFIYTPYRLEVLQKYVKDIYNLDLHFNQLNQKPLITHPIFGAETIINSYVITN